MPLMMTSAQDVKHQFSPFYCGTSWENLLNKHQDMLSLVTISFILMTCMFDQVMIL